MLANPCNYVIAYSVLLFFPYLWGAVIAAGMRDLTYHAIHNPAYQVMYSPISEENRGRAKIIIDGFGSPAALLTAFLVLTLTKQLPHWASNLFALVGAFFFMYIATRVKKAYVDAYNALKT